MVWMCINEAQVLVCVCVCVCIVEHWYLGLCKLGLDLGLCVYVRKF
jgi:hypothetical protein